MTQPSSTNAARESKVETLAKMRLLVGFLGEKDQHDWWPTSFLSPTGRRYLEFNFPRTVLSAGINSISHAAKELHDKRIGRSGVFHLFRLPPAIEQDIHALLAGEFKDKSQGLIESREQAIAALAELSEGESVSSEGPVRISSIGQLTHKPSLRKLAACYRSAFENGKQAFPYFTDE